MQGRKRRYIDRTAEEFYPDREDLRDLREQLPGGWMVATNLNNVLKKSIIKVASEVAGLTFGSDVIVDFWPTDDSPRKQETLFVVVSTISYLQR